MRKKHPIRSALMMDKASSSPSEIVVRHQQQQHRSSASNLLSKKNEKHQQQQQQQQQQQHFSFTNRQEDVGGDWMPSETPVLLRPTAAINHALMHQHPQYNNHYSHHPMQVQYRPNNKNNTITMDAQQVATAVATCSPLLVVPVNRDPEEPEETRNYENCNVREKWVEQREPPPSTAAQGSVYGREDPPTLFQEPLPSPQPKVTSANRLQSTDAPTSLQTRGFIKWGIPLPKDLLTATSTSLSPAENTMLRMESILMERLVWVRYRHDRYWWPAILYKNGGYKELIQDAPHVWNSQVSFWKRLSIVYDMVFSTAAASASISPAATTAAAAVDNNKTVPVARVLGRPGCELIELPQYHRRPHQEGKPEVNAVTADFFWQLPQILPVAACNIEFFAQDGDYDLYYDWHRALDQVECLLYDCLGRSMPLSPTATFATSIGQQLSKATITATLPPKWKHATDGGAASYTWVQRARQAERMQWEEHRKYVGCLLFMCGPEDEQPQKKQNQPTTKLPETTDAGMDVPQKTNNNRLKLRLHPSSEEKVHHRKPRSTTKA